MYLGLFADYGAWAETAALERKARSGAPGQPLINKTIPLYRLRQTARRRRVVSAIARPSERDAVSFTKSRDGPYLGFVFCDLELFISFAKETLFFFRALLRLRLLLLRRLFRTRYGSE